MSDHDPKPTETVDDVVSEALRGEVPRRDFLRRVVKLGVSSAVAYKLLDETTAQAQNGWKPKLTTYAIGEEGNPPNNRPPNRATTLAVGEESNRVPTTLSYGMGEEGTRPVTGVQGEDQSKRPTTLAVGEEQPVCPTPTTKAVGEENKPPPTTMRVGEESKVTTGAYGEESFYKPNPTTLAVGEEGEPTPRPTQTPKPNLTTRAVGEEGGGNPSGGTSPWKRIESLPTPWKNFRRW